MSVFEPQFVSLLLHFVFAVKFSTQLLQPSFNLFFLFRLLILKLKSLVIEHLLSLLSCVGFLLIGVSHLTLLLPLCFYCLLKTHLFSLKAHNKLAALLENRLFT